MQWQLILLRVPFASSVSPFTIKVAVTELVHHLKVHTYSVTIKKTRTKSTSHQKKQGAATAACTLLHVDTSRHTYTQ